MLDRVTKTSARGAGGLECTEDAAGSGGRTDDVPDAGQTAGRGQSPSGAHTREEGLVPQTCGVPGHQPGKASHTSYCM